MPTALRSGPYRLYFYSYDCGERKHVHVDRENLSAKFWFDSISLFENHGFNRKELRDIEQIIEDNLDTLNHEWDRFCNNA